MKRIVKRSLAMFLAMVMLLSSTTSALATVPPTDETTKVETTENVVENEEGSEEDTEEIKEHTDKATPDNAKDPTASDDDGNGNDEGDGNGGNDDETVYVKVSYKLTPEDGGKISVKDEIEAGDNLSFTVTPEDGYEIASVMVDSEELEPTSENEANGACCYAIKDVMADTHIDVEFAEVEDEAEIDEDEDLTGELEGEELLGEDETEETEAPGFVMLLDEAEIKIEEAEEGALEGVDSISVEALSQDDAIEEALLDQMKDGKDVADYAAFDITLYDEDGEEVEPKGAVNVVISGVSTDEEYDEVGIYHVKEMQIQRPMFFAAPAAINAQPQASNDVTEDADDKVSYHAEKVNKVDDKLEESGEISFVVEHFSTYVITFIKDAEEFTEINIYPVIYKDGDNSNPQPIDLGKDYSETLRIGEDTVDITSVISGNNLGQITAGGKTYVYKFATWGKNVGNIIENEFSYDEIKENKENGIYIWYEDISSQTIPVSVLFGNEEWSGFELAAGEITYTKAQAAISGDAHPDGVWTYYKAYIESKETSEAIKVEITSVHLENGNFYVTPVNYEEEYSYNSNDFKVVLEFFSGREVKVYVEDANSEAGNTVEGFNEKEYKEDAEGKYFVRQVSDSTTIEIPIQIGFGYRLQIFADSPNGTELYDSADNNYRDTNYNLTDEKIGESANIYVKFTNMSDALTLDYTHYVNEVHQEEIHAPGGSQYHNATVTLNGKPLDGQSTNPITGITDPSTLVISLDKDIANQDPSYSMNSFSINGYTVNAPKNPYPERNPKEPSWWNDNDDTERDLHSQSETTIKDSNGNVIANITIVAVANYTGVYEYPNNWIDKGDYIWSRDDITYTITISDIHSNLIITDFNMTGSDKEARFRNVDEGVESIVASNHDNVLINGLWKFPTNVTVTPVFGYYIEDVLLNDNPKLQRSNEWWNPQTVNSLNVTGNINYIDVATEKIKFSFAYKINDTEELELGTNTFTLGTNDISTGPFDDGVVPSNIPEGKAFVGWMLKEGGDPLQYGYTASDSTFGISRNEIENNKENVDYLPEVGKATITLYPAYIDLNQAEQVPYSVYIYGGNPNPKILTQYDGLSIRPVGSYIHLKTLINDIEPVKNALDSFKVQGLVLDETRSDSTLVLTKDESANVFNLYLKSGNVKITFEAGENGHLLDKDGQTQIESKTVYEIAGSSFTVVPEAEGEDKTYIFKGWKTPDGDIVKSLEDEPVPSKDSTYIAQFVLDENGDKEPDENQIKVIFRIEQEGITFNGTDVKENGETIILSDNGKTLTYWLTIGKDEYPDAPVNDDLIIGEGTKKALSGWSPEYDLKGDVSQGAVGGTYTAQFGDDLNGNGEPDTKDEHVTITFEAGEHGSFVAGAVTKYTDKLEGLTFDEAQILIPVTNADEGFAFKEWQVDGTAVELNGSTKVPSTDTIYKAVFGEDKNGDGIADEDQTIITIVFDAGADGLIEGEKTKTYYVAADGIDEYPEEPKVDVQTAKKVFAGWKPTYDLTGKVPVSTEKKTLKFTAIYDDDLNGDGIPDGTQNFQEAKLKPYDTKAYSGGAQEDGFPELALRYEQGERLVDDSVITSIVINGVRHDGKKTSDIFDAVYWQDGDVTARPNDDEGGTYNAAVVLKNEAADSIPGSVKGSDGLLVLDGRRILANYYDVVIEAEYPDAGKVIYDVSIDRATLIVRYVNADDVYRPVAANEAELQLEDGKTAAVVPEGAQLHVNGVTERPVDRDTADIRLLSDEVLDLADNRKQLLVDKGYETIGLDTATAEAQGYKSITRYFDLVDFNNGNAWVTSDQPTDVYITYPEVTDSNTDFTFLHFKDLHRESSYEDVPAAIAGADVEEVALELHEDYIKFSTKPGTEAFSPFMLIWKTDSSTTDPDDPGTGGDQPGTNEPSTGGDTPATSGSTPVSVSSDSSDTGYYYTVGVNGQWVHMDNVDVNQPLDEDVPAGATAVDFPEWHRWKFFRSNGLMLNNQWAHIENPYAVDGQPRSGWFYFDYDGLMRYGWYLDVRSGDWYYMHSVSDGMLGTMMTGWHYDDHDKRWYYLDPATGAMVTGWKQIDGKWYYFNPTPFGETWTLDHSQSVWRFNGNTVRPFGSMYQNEMTPDGYYVDENGVWVQ